MLASCYHYRDMAGNKVLGGSVAGQMDLNAAAIQQTVQLEIIVMNSGRLSYAYKGKPVGVYLSLDPSETEKGRAVRESHLLAIEMAHNASVESQKAQDLELQNEVNKLGIEKAIELLKAAK